MFSSLLSLLQSCSNMHHLCYLWMSVCVCPYMEYLNTCSQTIGFCTKKELIITHSSTKIVLNFVSQKEHIYVSMINA